MPAKKTAKKAAQRSAKKAPRKRAAPEPEVVVEERIVYRDPPPMNEAQALASALNLRRGKPVERYGPTVAGIILVGGVIGLIRGDLDLSQVPLLGEAAGVLVASIIGYFVRSQA